MELTKLLIVDDEAYIRHGIRYAIPWHDHSIEVIGEAATGREALEFCRHSAPDIVLTDIKMPQVSGLELAKILSEQMPRIKVIILTAYSEPDFFCDAIDSRVNSFIMKNANSKQILAAVLKAQKQFLADQKEQEVTRRLQNIYNENQHYLIELTFRQFLTGMISCGQFESKMRELDYALSDQTYAMIAMELSGLAAAEQTIRLYTLLAPYEPFIFISQEKYLVIILKTQTTFVTDETIRAAADLLGEHLIGKQIVYIEPIRCIREFPEHYRMLPDGMRMCFWDERIAFLTVRPKELPGTPDCRKIEDSEKKALSALLTDDVGKIREAVKQHYQLLEAMQVSRELFLNTMERIFITTAAQQPDHPDTALIPDLLRDIRHPAEVLTLYERFFRFSTKAEEDSSLLSRVFRYIDENYAAEIRLSDIARLVYLSEGYLSRIFKNETGYSFKEYLNKTRIEKAKQLVSGSDLKYYEIAELVGYRNYKYFAQYFHKYCGCSAKEYRTGTGRMRKLDHGKC